MRLLFIRHGDPDYTHDTLTEQGIREAKALARLIPSLGVGDCYVSPLGRARKTAQLALEGTGIIPVEKDWLQEFMTDYDVNGSRLLQGVFPNLKRMEDLGRIKSKRISLIIMSPTYMKISAGKSSGT